MLPDLVICLCALKPSATLILQQAGVWLGVPAHKRKNVLIPTCASSKKETSYWYHRSLTGHNLLLGQSSIPAVIMLKSNTAPDIQVLTLWSDQPITYLKSTHFKLRAILPRDWHICFHLNHFHDFVFFKECNYFCWDVWIVLISFKP